MSESRTEHPFRIYESMRKTPDLLDECLEGSVLQDIEALCAEFRKRKINRIYCLGTGSSFLAGIAQAFAFRMITGMNAEAWNSLEFRLYLPPGVDRHTAVLLNSHSGKSPGDVETIKRAKAAGAFTVAVTDIENTPLTESSDYCFLGPGGAKHEMPSTRTYATAVFRVLQFINALGRTDRKSGFHDYGEELSRIPGHMRQCIDFFDEKGPEYAGKLSGFSDFLVMAQGPNLSTAQEAAMGLTQATGLPAQGFLLEEYLHGQIQSLSEKDAVMIIASPGPCSERLAGFQKVAQRIGAEVFLFAPEDSPVCLEARDCIALPGGIDEVLTPVFYCVPFWFIGYHLSLKFGRDPDLLSMGTKEFTESGLARYKKEFT